MNQRDLELEVGAILQVTELEAERIVRALLQVMTASLRRGDAVKVQTFGTLRPAKRAGHLYGNPEYGGTVWKPPYTTIEFLMSKTLELTMNPPNEREAWRKEHESSV